MAINEKEDIEDVEVPAYYTWVISEYPEYARDRQWYIVASIVAILLLGLAVWYGNFLGAILVLLTAVIVVARHLETAPRLAISLRGDGIKVGEKLYSYSQMKSFWIIFEPPHTKTLYFDFQSDWKPRLPIPLGEADPFDVRDLLLKYLEEDLSRESEPISDALSRLLRL
ncbi:hypothetical protein COV04_00125 [Candidatus Uhrbacteria bacterium CG10_big_fil_rev_8_21_14_0_10_48_11]|uniref:DUF5673 domain-containing protein n=1 Tax=Candidatus Uhrbacteria bacterium CG10_big_fil_rev_8_21_14_0_10_48_11 TaxID=1975037 RepID=A0A2M8LFQ7_9BACT|nr:MAG: hypothetical protein COV04_00125 [Candidatus Uhrbacteria bacterium CG10_big_fil_rev_8_21_14_0_10_48_11]